MLILLRYRVLNTHYYMPPKHNCVELMTSGHTDSAIIDLLMKECASVGFTPINVKRESTGLIFNRIWAAIKRESLDVIAEGVAEPKDIDILFKDWFASQRGPSEMMDEVGLDTVYNIEKNYVQQRDLKTDTLDWLKKEYVDKKKLGQKTGNNGLLAETSMSNGV
jgi:3-hydroxyacyl-CoA dehydrogenase